MPCLHIIDRDYRRRAALSRDVLKLDSHAEIYEDYAEFLASRVDEGMVLIAHADSRILLQLLRDGEVNVPVLVYAEQPDPSEVVHAVQSGALDFFEWPASRERLNRVIQGAEGGANQKLAQLRKRAAAKNLVKRLSPRELDVLRGLLAGGSNKTIASALNISPRTVEIHRGKMMFKLNAGSTGDAVRIALYAGLEEDFEIAA